MERFIFVGRDFSSAFNLPVVFNFIPQIILKLKMKLRDIKINISKSLSTNIIQSTPHRAPRQGVTIHRRTSLLMYKLKWN